MLVIHALGIGMLVIWVIVISVIVFSENKPLRVIAWLVSILIVLGFENLDIVMPDERHISREIVGGLVLVGLLLLAILYMIKFAFSKIKAR
jgi:hypothetical protein